MKVFKTNQIGSTLSGGLIYRRQQIKDVLLRAKHLSYRRRLACYRALATAGSSQTVNGEELRRLAHELFQSGAITLADKSMLVAEISRPHL